MRLFELFFWAFFWVRDNYRHTAIVVALTIYAIALAKVVSP